MKKTFEMVNPSTIKVSENYQRALDEKRVKKIVKEWDDDLVDDIKVSRRSNGDLYVIDGQHTLEAWKLKKGPEVMRAVVYEGLSEEEEARLFASTNSCKKNVSYNETLRATLFSKKDENVNAYFSFLDSLEIPYSFGSGSISDIVCHKNAKKLFSSDKEILRKTLMSIRDGFQVSIKYSKYDARVILGIFTFLKTFSDNNTFSYERLCEVLKETNPKILNNQATINAGGSISFGGGNTSNKYIALVLADMYNKKLSKKNRLDRNKLLFSSDEEAK